MYYKEFRPEGIKTATDKFSKRDGPIVRKMPCVREGKKKRVY